MYLLDYMFSTFETTVTLVTCSINFPHQLASIYF